MTRRGAIVAAVLVFAVAAAVGSLLGWWDWKTLIGWRALVDYIDPGDATGRKDAVQVYALIVAGMVAAMTAAVGLAYLRFTRKSLDQQRELEAGRAREQRDLEAGRVREQRDLEDHRAQGTALRAYYEQMGKLLTEHDLGNTERDDIRLLAQAQTLTVLEDLEPSRKSRLVRFLIETFLVQRRDKGEPPIINLLEANLAGVVLRAVNLYGASLIGTDLSGADLSRALLADANLLGANLTRANLSEAGLSGANLLGANLTGADLGAARVGYFKEGLADLGAARLNRAILIRADLRGAKVTEEQLDTASSLEGATMPDGSIHD